MQIEPKENKTRLQFQENININEIYVHQYFEHIDS